VSPWSAERTISPSKSPSFASSCRSISSSAARGWSLAIPNVWPSSSTEGKTAKTIFSALAQGPPELPRRPAVGLVPAVGDVRSRPQQVAAQLPVLGQILRDRARHRPGMAREQRRRLRIGGELPRVGADVASEPSVRKRRARRPRAVEPADPRDVRPPRRAAGQEGKVRRAGRGRKARDRRRAVDEASPEEGQSRNDFLRQIEREAVHDDDDDARPCLSVAVHRLRDSRPRAEPGSHISTRGAEEA
jgi:hypothetical protein